MPTLVFNRPAEGPAKFIGAFASPDQAAKIVSALGEFAYACSDRAHAYALLDLWSCPGDKSNAAPAPVLTEELLALLPEDERTDALRETPEETMAAIIGRFLDRAPSPAIAMPTNHSGTGAIAQLRQILTGNPGIQKSAFVKLAEQAGLKASTASTQFYRLQKGTIRMENQATTPAAEGGAAPAAAAGFPSRNGNVAACKAAYAARDLSQSPAEQKKAYMAACEAAGVHQATAQTQWYRLGKAAKAPAAAPAPEAPAAEGSVAAPEAPADAPAADVQVAVITEEAPAAAAPEETPSFPDQKVENSAEVTEAPAAEAKPAKAKGGKGKK